ncbi:MAG: acetyl-CoA carboxylase biotin carboxyl carrier protein [candidate division KSB1 bacterium]|nr:acetyl-CoA carboxylase biotin carboxyl carrier protein [candidate division KSB1 bacterium]MDZ7272485.1 acetyl-CoA carboxylase biotin carboxyl carrier protein [candidate division KSB1 bacterium]MDZ7284491.1 acetyl-CoA carboxylase biotin carboxyl carrier protein [candidate division KSB1 bacterium]MDZ7297113.1 acetyl-CoA carboxylase biotin carboxyl carrier protein [candidate division KSB1 bacterium]MDZ7306561.1 acetyl-CoA carboxylase biotin carboxyl carrier protein [candidate division KSB1 bact
MNLDEIRELVKIVESSGIMDLEVTQRGSKVRISKYPGNAHAPAPMTAGHFVVPDQYLRPPLPAAGAPAPSAGHEPPASSAPAPASQKNFVEIKSPMVGTFYRAPAPDAEPYVNVGDTISKGHVLCIIEAMKLMNEIEAEFACRIIEILVENAQPVEYNQPLFRVEKL